MGLSTHQGFVTPDREKRFNIDRTIAQIEIAYDLGIPVMRVNTGTWGTSRDFDELMANRGVESPIEGYTDEDAYPWVIEAFEACLPTAESVDRARTREPLGPRPDARGSSASSMRSTLRLQVTTDTGNFLEDPYERLQKLALEPSGAGQDLFRRRSVVHPRSRLSTHRPDPADRRLSRLGVPGVRGHGGLADRDSEEPRASAHGVQSVVSVAFRAGVPWSQPDPMGRVSPCPAW